MCIGVPILFQCQLCLFFSPSFKDIGLKMHRTFEWPINPNRGLCFLQSVLKNLLIRKIRAKNKASLLQYSGNLVVFRQNSSHAGKNIRSDKRTESPCCRKLELFRLFLKATARTRPKKIKTAELNQDEFSSFSGCEAYGKILLSVTAAKPLRDVRLRSSIKLLERRKDSF